MTYTPRLTAPSYSDPLWIQVNSGGYNQCIYGSDGAPSVLPNCTGYVHGRCMEIADVTTDNLGLSFGNAVEYWNGSSSDWEQSSEPSLGAVIVYSQNGGWEPGHVAIVEQILDNDTIVISQSDYGGNRFSTWTCTRATNWTPFTNVSFLGFLTNPYVDDRPPTPPTPPVPTGSSLIKKWYACNNIRGIINNRNRRM